MSLEGLDGQRVDRVSDVLREAPSLSVHDGFAFVVAERHPGCILLTGDKRLRSLAEDENMEVHGVLWVIEELERHGRASRAVRMAALEIWRDDPTSRMPEGVLKRMIARHRRGR